MNLTALTPAHRESIRQTAGSLAITCGVLAASPMLDALVDRSIRADMRALVWFLGEVERALEGPEPELRIRDALAGLPGALR